MDMLTNAQIAQSDLDDWRKLAQGLHARYAVGSLRAGAGFATTLVEVGEDVGEHLRVRLDARSVDLTLLSGDAVHRDELGVEHVVVGVTQRDVDLARRISQVAADHRLVADPAGIIAIELGLDTAHAATLSPVWAALLTGGTEASGHGNISDEVCDPLGRVPVLWFQETDEHETPRQRFHLDVWVAPEVADARIAAAVAAGGVVVDDSEAPSFTVLADPDGNRACVCTSLRGAGGGTEEPPTAAPAG
ncbi:VOC family protein [Knoellia sp. CPCC 206435]|uniref:VOC family protein n=1 Tax=Knoellia terrae TaxID=3404797 RepID=UPI003B43C0CB